MNNMENLALSNQDLFNEIVERGRHEGALEQEAFHQLVETVLEEHQDVGELDKDQDIELMEDELKARWAEYQGNM